MALRGYGAVTGHGLARLTAVRWPRRQDAQEAEWAPGLRLLLASLIVAATLTLGLYLDSGILTLLGAGLVILFGLVRPEIGLMSLLLVAPLLTRPVLPAPGFQFFAVGAIVLGSVYRLPLERPRLTIPPLFLLLVGYVGYVFIQQLPEMLAGYPSEELREIGSMMAKLLTALGLVLATSLVVRGRSPYPYLAALIVSVSIAASAGVITFLDAGYGVVLGGLLAEAELGARASGLFANPNYFGQFMAAGIILALGWYAGWGRGRVRPLLVLALGLMGTALLVSQSRGALVALAGGLIAAAFARSRKTGYVAIIIGGLLVVALVPLVLEARLARNAGFDPSAALEQQAASDAFRANALALGPELLMSSPIFGLGLFQFTLETGIYPHNWFLRITTEHGIVGLTMAVLILFFAARRFRSLPTMPRAVAFGILGMVVVGSMFLEPQANIQSFLLLAFTLTVVVSADWDAGRVVGRPKRRVDGAAPRRRSGGRLRGSSAAGAQGL